MHRLQRLSPVQSECVKAYPTSLLLVSYVR